MTRRFGIIVALLGVLGGVVIDWTLGVPPDPFRAPDPMAFGSTSGASGENRF
ncbi:MAG: hypothetical protein O3A68_03955 [Proteobacteria bacterium]|nr:hypothetical protein [Pseudomonadota bacterium]